MWGDAEKAKFVKELETRKVFNLGGAENSDDDLDQNDLRTQLRQKEEENQRLRSQLEAMTKKYEIMRIAAQDVIAKCNRNK